MFFLFSGDLMHSLSCFNSYESFGAFVSLSIVRYSKTSFMIIYPMFLEKILQKEKYYFLKDSLSAGAAHKLGFPAPHAQGPRSIPVHSLGAAKTDGQEIYDLTSSGPQIACLHSHDFAWHKYRCGRSYIHQI